MAKTDLARIKHMHDAACLCIQFAAKKKQIDLENDTKLSFAIIRSLEIIGEAAANMSKQTQLKYSQIPWKAIIGMRNRLIHAYFDIDYEIIWKAITHEIPQLIVELEIILEEITN